jgi:16S rRNA (cytidine1402-2'-O)-methyltransferase
MGTLYVVSTPIGNLEDITIRAIKTLLSVDVVACEDTRHTGQLLKILFERYANYWPEITFHKPEFVSVRDWNEAESVDNILFRLQLGNVALVSDAGTPLISDPGYKVVRAAKAQGFKVVPIPGVNAAITALSVSGLPTNKFMFWGFLPKSWELLSGITNIIYESPIRTKDTIQAILTKYPNAEIIIARELTKIHEEVSSYVDSKEINKGEVTLVVYIPKSESD